MVKLPVLILALAALQCVPMSLIAQSIEATTSLGKPGAIRVDAVYVELTEFGFYPSSLDRKPGKFVLVVRNLVQQKIANFKLEAVGNTASLREAGIDGKKFRFQEVLDLAPGDYTLQSTNGKGRALTIRVRP